LVEKLASYRSQVFQLRYRMGDNKDINKNGKGLTILKVLK